MSWQEDGCYKQGTVEMMNSPMVIVAYITSSEDMSMPGRNPETGLFDYTWNSKKWRELFIVNPHMIGNIKAYPYRNNALTKEVLIWLKELAEKVNLGVYTKDIINYDTYERFTIPEFNLNTIIHPYTGQMYNDFTRNQFAFFAPTIPSLYEFSYSGPSQCMSCGKINPYLEHEGRLVGECCEMVYRCEYCDDVYYDEDCMYEIDGTYLCEYCYNERTCEDSINGELHLKDNLAEIWLLSEDGKHYSSCVPIFIHCDNYNEEILKEYFKKIYKIQVHAYYNTRVMIRESDLTEAGKELFAESFKEANMYVWNELSNTVPADESFIQNFTSWDDFRYCFPDNKIATFSF